MMNGAEIRYIGGRKFVAENRHHTFTIDLPQDSGGRDEGPTPPEVFINSLASCVGVYVAGYCEKVGLNAKGLVIRAGWEKEMEKKPYRIKRIAMKIDLPHADVGKRKEAILKIARSCLIHETIKNQPQIDIELA